MLTTWGQGLTGVGTILAIIHPSIGAQWASERTQRKDRWLRLRYYIGTALIIIGTALQMFG